MFGDLRKHSLKDCVILQSCTKDFQNQKIFIINYYRPKQLTFSCLTTNTSSMKSRKFVKWVWNLNGLSPSPNTLIWEHQSKKWTIQVFSSKQRLRYPSNLSNFFKNGHVEHYNEFRSCKGHFWPSPYLKPKALLGLALWKLWRPFWAFTLFVVGNCESHFVPHANLKPKSSFGPRVKVHDLDELGPESSF